MCLGMAKESSVRCAEYRSYMKTKYRKELSFWELKSSKVEKRQMLKEASMVEEVCASTEKLQVPDRLNAEGWNL